MRYLWPHINVILKTYANAVPLSYFLKAYYKQYPILGSRDRKMLSAMAYSWYRCAKGIDEIKRQNIEETILMCMAICQDPMLAKLAVDPPKTDTLSIDPTVLFPATVTLSSGITHAEWLASMLVQPDLFIRLRKDHESLINTLQNNNIIANRISANCLALPNGSKADQLLPPDAYVVQDASSQATGDALQPQAGEQWYDCCCGAGGKSLLLKDRMPSVKLTVTDKRASIIHNLTQRFRQYGHQLPHAIVTDAANADELQKALGNSLFDGIICDVPCTGSGTWARTPEQLYFFDPASIKNYSARQKAIAVNAAKYLASGGRFIYITCSVFKEENEGVVEEIVSKTGLTVESAAIINGTSIKADSMFVAVLRGTK